MTNRRSILPFAVAAVLLAASLDASACATCFGKSDSRMAQGMNMGILALLAVIGSVLAGVVSFFVHVAKRSAALAAEDAFNDEGTAEFPEDPQTDQD